MWEFPLPSLELARKEIDADPACRRLGLSEREDLARVCWDRGQRAARTWLPDGDADLVHHIACYGARVVIDDAGLGVCGGFVSEYQTSGSTIVLHRGALRAWAQVTGRRYPDLVQVALAHELFHHLECSGAIDLLSTAGILRRSLVLRRPLVIVPRGAIEAYAHGFASVRAGACCVDEPTIGDSMTHAWAAPDGGSGSAPPSADSVAVVRGQRPLGPIGGRL